MQKIKDLLAAAIVCAATITPTMSIELEEQLMETLKSDMIQINMPSREIRKLETASEDQLNQLEAILMQEGKQDEVILAEPE
jgi:hypothetical protein